MIEPATFVHGIFEVEIVEGFESLAGTTRRIALTYWDIEILNSYMGARTPYALWEPLGRPRPWLQRIDPRLDLIRTGPQSEPGARSTVTGWSMTPPPGAWVGDAALRLLRRCCTRSGLGCSRFLTASRSSCSVRAFQTAIHMLAQQERPTSFSTSVNKDERICGRLRRSATGYAQTE